MTVVVVGNEKGGCGKTTIAVNIAALAAGAGYDTILVDADQGQQSAAKWWARRQDYPAVPRLELATMTAGDLGSLQKLTNSYGFVVIDTGAMDSPHLRASILVANLLVIPVQPDELDLWTLPTMERLYTYARTENTALQALIVLNRMPYQTTTRLYADAKGWIAGNVPGLQDAPLIPMVGRSAYGRASGSGLAVTEPRARDTKAASEIGKLFLEVVRRGATEQIRQERNTGSRPRKQRK